MDNPKIVVDNLSYRYPTAQRFAIENISFSVSKGEFVGVIGRNGSGKSTLCLSISGLAPKLFRGKRLGSVLINGVDVLEMSGRDVIKKVGLVLQNPFSQISGAKMTVFEEVAFGLENLGVERNEIIEKVENILKKVGLWQKRHDNPFELSGGQLQRLAIASMLVLEPEVIILDEPTSQLDPQGTVEVFEILTELRKSGFTIILVEHKLEKLVEYADRILFLNDGKLIAYDEPEKVFSMEEVKTYGVGMPIYTSFCKKLNIRNQSGYYPVKFDETVQLIKSLSGMV